MEHNRSLRILLYTKIRGNVIHILFAFEDGAVHESPTVLARRIKTV
jgi:hypothetical protein